MVFVFNTFSNMLFFLWICLGCLGFVPRLIPIPGVNVKVPFRRKNMGKNILMFLNLLRFGGIWGVLNGPSPTHHPTPIPGVNVKVPFRRNKYGK